MKILEALKDITNGGIMFPSPKTSYIEGNTKKDEETSDFAPDAAPMRLGHAPYTHDMTKMAYASSHDPKACRSRSETTFHLFSGEILIFISTSGANSPYKYHSAHS
jgi:hypothetical protein